MYRVNRPYYGFGSNFYENLVSNNFKTAFLKRNVYCKLNLHSKGL